MEDTRRFFAFMREELPRSLERWQAHSADDGQDRPTTGGRATARQRP